MLELQRLEATIHQSIPPHKNIITLYRTYETPEWLFLVLEYCPGQDLYYWLEQAHDVDGESEEAAQAIMFRQTCEAVQFCHDRGIAHRDLKPENLIVYDRRGELEQQAVIVKLTDFGLATADAECRDFSCGSRPYMSPECHLNLSESYDPFQADVWSLGIVLLNM
ncbi:Pkinase-domain-containing protein, partial [Microstroma glucosiphilum]